VELEALLDLERERRTEAAHELRRFLGAGAADFVVGVVGRLAEVKLPLAALALFRGLAARYPGLHLAFVGDGELRRTLERELGALPAELARRAHLLGARSDMPAVLGALDAVLLTSRTEGMPVALIEAGAAALPVVARAVGGVGELVVHERTGWLGTSDDELQFGLDRLLADPRAARAMGERARLRVARQHGAETLAARLEELYTHVVAERTAEVGT
jgi:glycosyltransferase involved in cell wall biosynthesis